MSARSVSQKTKERFIGIPYRIAISQQFADLRAPEIKLLVDILTQYNGKNNGRLSTCHALLKKRGWAPSSLYRAYSNLVHAGFLVITRQGWKQRGRPTLVAITWNGIDKPGDIKFDDEINPSSIPLRYWEKEKSKWKHQPRIKQQKKQINSSILE